MQRDICPVPGLQSPAHRRASLRMMRMLLYRRCYQHRSIEESVHRRRPRFHTSRSSRVCSTTWDQSTPLSGRRQRPRGAAHGRPGEPTSPPAEPGKVSDRPGAARNLLLVPSSRAACRAEGRTVGGVVWGVQHVPTRRWASRRTPRSERTWPAEISGPRRGSAGCRGRGRVNTPGEKIEPGRAFRAKTQSKQRGFLGGLGVFGTPG